MAHSRTVHNLGVDTVIAIARVGEILARQETEEARAHALVDLYEEIPTVGLAAIVYQLVTHHDLLKARQ